MNGQSRLEPAPNYPKTGTEAAEQALEATRTAVTAAGDIIAARYADGHPPDLAEALGRLQEALDHILFLECWDDGPPNGQYPLWNLMARRHLPAQGELYEEHYVPRDQR